MKLIVMSFAASSLLAALAVAQPTSSSADHLRSTRYTVTDIGTLPGGTFSQATFVDDDGVVTGVATLPDGTPHAVIWYQGRLIDIGTRERGKRSAALISAGFGVNGRGQAVGLAEISTTDPNEEDFCGYGTGRICLPFLWQDGKMKMLPTLGGHNGEAGQINNRGVVAGNVETAELDTTCGPDTPQKLKEKPVFWENGRVHPLQTIRGDPDGWAFGINDNGQIVGASGVCSTLNPLTGVYVSSHHALLWENGLVRDLGNLGGTGDFGPGNVAQGINNRSEVVGSSDNGDASFQAFLWTRETRMRGLGTLPGDVNSGGLGINDSSEVVGVSTSADGSPRAFFWKNDVMTDLNDPLMTADSPLFLLFAHSINSSGEIAGFGVTSTGDVHGFVATPRHGRDH